MPNIQQEFIWKGKVITVKDIAKFSGMSMSGIYARLRRGWPLEAVINGRRYISGMARRTIRVKYTGKKYPASKGKRMDLAAWSKELDIPVTTLRTRSYRKWPDNEIIEGRKRKQPTRSKNAQ